MTDVDVAADADLRQRALEAVRAFVKEADWPVARTQINGLMQIVANEPQNLAMFAGKQKERAEKRLQQAREDRKEEFQRQVDFWVRVQTLVQGKGANCPWSLEQVRDAELPNALRAPSMPRAQLSPAQRAESERVRPQRDAWLRQWERDHYMAFFRHFCAEYLFEMPPENEKT